MHDLHDDIDGFLNDAPARGEFEFPAPLDSWTLNDFSDLVMTGRAMA